MIRRNFLVFKDTPITSAQVREAIDLYFNREKFAGTTSTAFVTVKTGEPKKFTITHSVDENGAIKTEVVEVKPT